MRLWFTHMHQIDEWLKNNAQIYAEYAMGTGREIKIGYHDIGLEWYIEFEAWEELPK